jgi:segregation and condensation protein A
MSNSEGVTNAGETLILSLNGFEGPLDLLLDLARAQKVDLGQISILALVDQYLAMIESARRIRLELAADWLVMAAWLAWLKSRLLVPEDDGEAEEGEVAAEILAERLRALETIRSAAGWLNARPILGIDLFARGVPEDFTEIDRSRIKLDIATLLPAYLAAMRRAGAKRQYRPRPMIYWSVQDALARLTQMLGNIPQWSELEAFLPPAQAQPLARRAAHASTLIAGLELARSGAVMLRQEAAFGPILIRQAEADE